MNKDKRLYIAAILAENIEPPHNSVNDEETHNKYEKWASKLIKMADYLIKKNNETSFSDTFSN